MTDVTYGGVRINQTESFKRPMAVALISQPVPAHRLGALKRAIDEMRRIGSKNEALTKLFSKIGNEMGLDALMRRARISWSPLTGLYDGFVYKVGSREICVTERAIRENRLIGALFHELAHSGGVTGNLEPNDKYSHYRCYQAAYLATGFISKDEKTDFAIPGISITSRAEALEKMMAFK